jgi:peroxiredoxin
VRFCYARIGYSVVLHRDDGRFLPFVPGAEPIMPPISDPLTAVLIAGLVVAVAVIALLGWLCYRLLVDRGNLLLRQPPGGASGARASQRVRGLSADSYLSDFALPVLASPASWTSGATVTLSALVGRPLLIVFLRADCFFSRAFARELANQAPRSDAPLLVSIVVGEIGNADAAALFTNLPGFVLLDAHGQVARLMRIRETPSGYLVSAERRTAEPLMAGPTALLAAQGGVMIGSDDPPLAVNALPSGSSEARTPLPVGSPAPDFTLPKVGGGEWSLASHHGEPLTLLFSDLSCPPCVTLLRDLGPRAGPNVVIISRGDAEENRQLVEASGIAAPILLQRQREVARAYRTLETPAAFHIDERGEIAAGPAIGREAVRALLVEIGSGTMR